MVFVPDAVPNFVLVCHEDSGWSVRDYSTGELRLLPAIALGRPIEELVEGARAKGCFAFGAPRVAVAELNFWKCLTDELGKRFLGAPPAVRDGPGNGYPVLAEQEFKAATRHLTSLEVERLVRSPRASDWTTWNAIHLLIAAHAQAWWNEVAVAAARINPANHFFLGGGSPPETGFWKTAPPSEAYDKWLRRTIRERSGRFMSEAPLEPPSRVDVGFDGGRWMVFAESRIRQPIGPGTYLDPRRNRIVQLADCLVTAAKGRPCALWIFASDRLPGLEHMELVERYRSSPEMFAAELPYHPAEVLYALAERLTVLQWSDVIGPLTMRKASDDPVMARVRKELRRRIQGPGVVTAAVGA